MKKMPKKRTDYCEQCGKFVETTIDIIGDAMMYCPDCNCDMRGEEDENDHSYEERIKDGFEHTKEME